VGLVLACLFVVRVHRAPVAPLHPADGLSEHTGGWLPMPSAAQLLGDEAAEPLEGDGQAPPPVGERGEGRADSPPAAPVRGGWTGRPFSSAAIDTLVASWARGARPEPEIVRQAWLDMDTEAYRRVSGRPEAEFDDLRARTRSGLGEAVRDPEELSGLPPAEAFGRLKQLLLASDTLHYNRDADTLGHRFNEDRLQCSSASVLVVLAWMGLDPEAARGRPVFIHSPGHVRPGLLLGEELVSVEATARGAELVRRPLQGLGGAVVTDAVVELAGRVVLGTGRGLQWTWDGLVLHDGCAEAPEACRGEGAAAAGERVQPSLPPPPDWVLPCCKAGPAPGDHPLLEGGDRETASAIPEGSGRHRGPSASLLVGLPGRSELGEVDPGEFLGGLGRNAVSAPKSRLEKSPLTLFAEQLWRICGGSDLEVAPRAKVLLDLLVDAESRVEARVVSGPEGDAALGSCLCEAARAEAWPGRSPVSGTAELRRREARLEARWLSGGAPGAQGGAKPDPRGRLSRM
jgi:hypothetical protein